MEFLDSMVSSINGFLWTYIIITLLVVAGFYFTFRLNFVQIRHFKEMFRLIISSAGSKTKGNEISSFQAFCVSTASRVGVGNIAGIAIAITTGGPGSIFWMWFIAVIGAATGFVESTLAQIYKVPSKGKHGETIFKGGPAYYLKNGLGHSIWAAIFAILISVTYGLIYNSVQANTISLALNSAFGFDRTIVGIVIAVLAVVVICGGLGRIARVTEWMVPVMAGIYIITALGIMIYHFDLLPHVFAEIFENAFNFEAIFGGGMGAAVLTGFKRGLFSNEAGEGSVPNAAATADANHPVVQGLIQGFGVYVDTLFICSASAFIILLSGEYSTTGLTGIELVQWNLAQYFGDIAPTAVSILIFLFAFSSIVGNYYYGEININHLTKNKWVLYTFRILIGFMVFFGSVADLPLVWDLADLFMAFQVLTNVSAILILFPKVKEALDDYEKQQQAGVASPKFVKNVLSDTKGVMWWNE
ncbi:alanine/glycine:cation symporter family protein [Dialister pneumosintes]|uniref:Alanine:cation symporter family protein n=1 Tax=Dialister pneumosintes TaxID=39950 RepID=A0ABX9MB64_9FIRM|nr:alanine/glycine:cation symporter family protein [Dialister pneumosintes]RID94122.1 alanine:cation symporter family protein [Dialister pneumosintes]CDF27007.1 amino acid carrier protein [Dialister sp. CAG:588]